MQRDKKSRTVFLRIIFVVLGLIFMHFLIRETVTKQIIAGFTVIVTIVIAFAKGRKIAGISDIIELISPVVSPLLIRFFSDTTFVSKISKWYTYVVNKICVEIGKDTEVIISAEMAVTITAIIIWILFEILNNRKDRTGMKVLRNSEDDELNEKGFAEKSEMFCATLKQWIEEINRESNWNESQFTPLEAEVEVDTGGKRKKKYEDVLKCLKNNRRQGTVYLVLGSPGAGKSVSMRKLCLDLLKESKKTKKIPLYVNLKEWDKDWNLEDMPEKRDLVEFIRNSLKRRGDYSTERFLNEYFDRMLDDGRWYFVFDSFDEMPCLMGKRNCQELIDHISSLLYQLMTGPNQSGGVIASRFYRSPSAAVGATVTLKIQEFSDVKIRTMLKKYSTEQAIKLLFNGREDLVTLCRNPFYLELLINYIDDNGLVLPKNQMELYHSFIKGRLTKCAGKLEEKNIKENEIYQASKVLSLFMQETEGGGLECRTSLLYRRDGEEYWRKIFELLRYAKICRFGGQNETISFVHRRFQEFFLVECIIDQKKSITYENYRDILTDTGLRDALALYCEIAEEEKAREVANFCWQTIRNNVDYANNINARESQELVRILYFMKEAFRNRKEVLSEFEEEFYLLVKRILKPNKREHVSVIDRFIGKYLMISKKQKNNGADHIEEQKSTENCKEVDYVVLLAFVNSMILFSKDRLKELVLDVFNLNNRWLNDVIMQNCRNLDTLDYHIENEFISYFRNMGTKNFFKKFANIRFSLSISTEFRYIRKMHLIMMLLDAACLISLIYIGLIAAINIICNIFHVNIQLESLSVIFELIGSLASYVMAVAISSLFSVIYGMVVLKLGKFHFAKRFTLICFEICTIVLLCQRMNIIILIISCFVGAHLIAILAIYIILMVGHSIRHVIEHFKTIILRLIESVKYHLLELIIALLSAMVGCVAVLSNKFEREIMCFSWSCIALIIGAVLIFAVRVGWFYIKDIIWLKKHNTGFRRMQRTNLEISLNTLKYDSSRYRYLEILLLQKVELYGEWSSNARPQYNDDRVNHTLAKLDCAKLDFCDYLF